MVYSTSFCGDCIRAKHFLDEHAIEYEDVDIDRNPHTASIVERINDGNRSVPTIIVSYENDEDKILIEPSREQLEEVFLD